MSEARFIRLSERLTELGHLGESEVLREISYLGGQSVSLVWAPDSLPIQRQEVQALIDEWDWRERRPRSVAEIKEQLATLTTQQRNQLLTHLLAVMLHERPELARRAGLAIDGEVVRGGGG